MLFYFMLYSRSLKLSLFFKILFTFVALSRWVHCFVFQLIDLFSVPCSLLLNPSSILKSSAITVFSSVTSVWHFLLFFFYWISDYVHPFTSQVQCASLWPLPWILYQVDILNSISLRSFSEVFSSSFIWNIFVCFLICLISVFVSMY